MSKYYLQAEKKLLYVNEGLQKLMVIQGQCNKAMMSKDEQEHKGVSIVSGIMLKNIAAAISEIDNLFKENKGGEDTTTEED